MKPIFNKFDDHLTEEMFNRVVEWTNDKIDSYWCGKIRNNGGYLLFVCRPDDKILMFVSLCNKDTWNECLPQSDLV